MSQQILKTSWNILERKCCKQTTNDIQGNHYHNHRKAHHTESFHSVELSTSRECAESSLHKNGGVPINSPLSLLSWMTPFICLSVLSLSACCFRFGVHLSIFQQRLHMKSRQKRLMPHNYGWRVVSSFSSADVFFWIKTSNCSELLIAMMKSFCRRNFPFRQTWKATKARRVMLHV